MLRQKATRLIATVPVIGQKDTKKNEKKGKVFDYSAKKVYLCGRKRIFKYIYIAGIVAVLAIVGCTESGGTKGAAGGSQDAGFAKTNGVADSLYNSMQFRDAYKLYLQLLDNKEAEADSEKRLSVLNSLCITSKLSGNKVEQHKWLQQLRDLAEQTGNNYYQSLAYITMGQNLFYEGDREKGIYYVNEGIDLMAKTDSAYAVWEAVQYEGNHSRDYFIVDYMKKRGRFQEAVPIYNDLIERVRQQGDSLGEMMNTAKWGLAEVYRRMGHCERAATLYEQVLEIQDTLKTRKAKHTAQELAAIYHDQEQEQTIMQ